MNKQTRYYLLFLSGILMLIYSCKSTSKTVSVSKQNDLNPEMEIKFRDKFYTACKEKILGNEDKAFTLFEECLKLNPLNAAVKYELAGLSKLMGLTEDALKYAKEAANTDLKNQWYQYLYIDCLHNKRKYAEAVAIYERMIKNNQPQQQYYEGLAQEAMFAGKPEKTIKAYDEIELKFGRTEDIALKKINVLKQIKKYSDAEKCLKQLIVDFPGQAQYYTFLGELYQQMNQPEKAFVTYQEILKQQPENPYLHLALADYYRIKKNDSLFFQEIKHAFKSEELEVDSKLKIMISYYEMTDLFPVYRPQAYELLSILKEIHPKEAKVWSGYGDFLFRDKKHKEAQECYLKAIELDNSKFMVWSQLMMCDYDLSDFMLLEKHSTESLEFFPDLPTPYFFNGLANSRLKRYDKAIQSFSDGKALVYENIPLQIQFLVNIADVYNSLKQYQKSDESFEEALSLNPNDALVLNNYAYFLSIRKDKLEKAEKLSERSLALFPNSISFMDTYSWVLYQQKKYEEAKKWIEKALEKGADNRSVILEHYGDILFKLNKVDEAIEYWKKAKEKGGDQEKLDKKISERNTND